MIYDQPKLRRIVFIVEVSKYLEGTYLYQVRKQGTSLDIDTYDVGTLLFMTGLTLNLQVEHN